MRILIADDHEIVRHGLKQMLADEFDTVVFGEATTAAELLQRVWKEKWDLVLLDISMPGRSGLDALGDLKKSRPHLPVLMLSMFPEAEYALRALKAGAAGYLSKQSVAQELLEAVRKVLAGGRYITPSLAQKLADEFSRPAGRLPHEELSNREYEIMKRLAAGQSVKEIAAALALSPKTVFTYRARLLEKLGLKGDVEVARYALQHHLVE